MMEDFDASHGKSAGDLGREAVWYTLHTIFAVLVLAVVVIGFWVAHTDPDATSPKVLATSPCLPCTHGRGICHRRR